MKINLTNQDYFDGENRFKLKREIKKGVLIITTAAVIGASIIGGEIFNNDLQVNESIPFSTEISKSSINDMNIIINDYDCGDSFFEAVCDNLRNDGVEFTTTKDGVGINRDGATVITLDQQYSSGQSTLIFAPYNNARVGYSDSLALSMQAAFLQNGFFADAIYAGKVGFVSDENGNVSNLKPTTTEDNIDSDNDTSFVVISFGTTNTNPEWVAKSIESGLARQKYYLDNYDTSSDLIYRSNSGEEVKVVADYFGTSVDSLVKYNGLVDKNTLNSQAIINPEADKIEAFDKDSMFFMDDIKTRAY